ncbi:MAG TPA: hypothetical protein VME22_32690 [Solirubrobacteraceae bacterium]|nr:hypothetical protein [Solirubrobacteraceae bacterium]
MAIQSATALNAYLTSVSSGQSDAGISSATTPDEGAVAQGSDTAASRQEQARSQDAAAQPASEELGEAPGGEPAAVAAALPALYGRNARSVMAGLGPGGGSISLLA